MTVRTVLVIIAIAVGLLGVARPAAAQVGTAFTYQGEMTDGGSLANGPYDMDFLLFDALNGGAQQGSTISLLDVTVTNGRFTVQLDFGAGALNGDARWLEIVDEGVTLTPRQPVTAAPIASQLRGVFVNTPADFVGVGRDYRIGSEYFGVHTPAVGGNYGGMYMSTEAETARPFYGYAAGGTGDMWHYYDGTTGRWHVYNGGHRLTVENNGEVGIGTTAPARQLEVQNSQAFARLRSTSGNSGSVLELMAPAGVSNIVGSIDFLDAGATEMGSIYYVSSIVGNRLYLRNNGNDAIAIDQLGNVGMGTLFPTGRLHVDGTGADFGIVVTGDDADERGVALMDDEDTWVMRNYAGSFGFIRLFDGGFMHGLVIENDGRVGIGGNNPSYMLEVDGSAGKPGGGSWSNSSDARLKKNVEPISNALNRLLTLRGVTFEYKDPEAINELPGERIGMIAQEVEQVVPDWVDERDDGYKTVTYRGFEALAVEALRELERRNQQLAAENAAVLDRLERLESLVAARQPGHQE